jgi:hypothetical protein
MDILAASFLRIEISRVEKPWLNLQIDIRKKIDEVMEQICNEVQSLNMEYVAIRRRTSSDER